MKAGEVPLTLVGGVKAKPELRYTANGRAVANFDVASTKKKFNEQSNQWEDGATIWVPIVVWGKQAEEITNQLDKGTQVIVVGEWQQSSWEAKDGTRRSRLEGVAQKVGIVIRPKYDEAPQGGGFGQQSSYGGGGFGQQSNTGGQFGQSAPAFGGGEEEPPF